MIFVFRTAGRFLPALLMPTPAARMLCACNALRFSEMAGQVASVWLHGPQRVAMLCRDESQLLRTSSLTMACA